MSGSWLGRLLAELTGFAEDTQGRVRLHTVSLIRWVAVIGQLFTILFVHFSLGIALPVGVLVPAVILSAVVNLLLSLGLAHFTGQADLSQMSWLWFTLFVGANLFQSGFTKFCPLDSILKKLGVPESAPGAGGCA